MVVADSGVGLEVKEVYILSFTSLGILFIGIKNEKSKRIANCFIVFHVPQYSIPLHRFQRKITPLENIYRAATVIGARAAVVMDIPAYEIVTVGFADVVKQAANDKTFAGIFAFAHL